MTAADDCKGGDKDWDLIEDFIALGASRDREEEGLGGRMPRYRGCQGEEGDKALAPRRPFKGKGKGKNSSRARPRSASVNSSPEVFVRRRINVK